MPQAEAAAGRTREIAVEAEAAARHAHPLLVERQRPSNRSCTGQLGNIMDGRLAKPSFLVLGLLDSSSDHFDTCLKASAYAEADDEHRM